MSLLADLRELRLSYNRGLTRLDTVDFAKLEALTILDVSNCHISDISAIEALPLKLQTLIFDNNDVKEIPSWLSRFTNILNLSFHGNPQRNVRQAVIDRGTGAIMDLLRSRCSVR
jgi:Leucine-rich repeat (LRR) protein